MPILSEISQAIKINYFLRRIPKKARILEVGCGTSWAKDFFKYNGWKAYVGLDLVPPADIVGDIRNWRNLGIEEGSFDVIIAFEVVEHVNCIKDCYDILKPGGVLMLTSPLPYMDWLLKILEKIGLNQKRTSEHSHLIDFKSIPYFKKKIIRNLFFLAQWGIFHK